MRLPTKRSPYTFFSVQLPKDVDDEARALAKLLGVSRNRYINAALKEYNEAVRVHFAKKKRKA